TAPRTPPVRRTSCPYLTTTPRSLPARSAPWPAGPAALSFSSRRRPTSAPPSAGRSLSMVDARSSSTASSTCPMQTRSSRLSALGRGGGAAPPPTTALPRRPPVLPAPRAGPRPPHQHPVGLDHPALPADPAQAADEVTRRVNHYAAAVAGEALVADDLGTSL